MADRRATRRRQTAAEKYSRLAASFARNLREIRGEKTIRDFAERISMFHSEWHSFETGRKQPSFAKLLEICDKLKRTPDELIFGEGRAKRK